MDQNYDIEATVELSKQFYSYISTKLSIKDTQFIFRDEYNRSNNLNYDDFIKKCNAYFYNRKYETVAFNCLAALTVINPLLTEIREGLDNPFNQLIYSFGLATKEIEELRKENNILQSQVNLHEKEIFEYKDRIHEIEKEALRKENELLRNSSGSNPQNYFTEKPVTNVASVELTNSAKIKEEVIDDETENIEFINLVNSAHQEVLQIMKDDPESLYPLHKIDITAAQIKYKTIWDSICPRYQLSPNDYPDIIDNLEEFVDMDDEILDDITNFEI